MRKRLLPALLFVVAATVFFLWRQSERKAGTPPAPVRTVFFLIDAASNRLTGVARQVVLPAGEPERIQKILDEYLAMQISGCIHPLPPEVVLRVETVAAGVVTVMVSRGIDRLPEGTDSELKAVYGIVNTVLANAPEYGKVKLNVEDGRRVLRGHVDITEGLEKREEY